MFGFLWKQKSIGTSALWKPMETSVEAAGEIPGVSTDISRPPYSPNAGVLPISLAIYLLLCLSLLFKSCVTTRRHHKRQLTPSWQVVSFHSPERYILLTLQQHFQKSANFLHSPKFSWDDRIELADFHQISSGGQPEAGTSLSSAYFLAQDKECSIPAATMSLF